MTTEVTAEATWWRTHGGPRITICAELDAVEIEIKAVETMPETIRQRELAEADMLFTRRVKP